MENNIKMDRKEIILAARGWSLSVEDRDQWWAVENIVMNFPEIL
jgi:hypothetical protein